VILIVLLFCGPICAEDGVFKGLRLAYVGVSFLDWQTTYHASRFPWYEERNVFTRAYWRSPGAFCAFKAVEVVVLDGFFRWVYRKSRVLGCVTVMVFAVFRYMAARDNLAVLRGGR